jgi:hypothetical protein
MVVPPAMRKRFSECRVINKRNLSSACSAVSVIECSKLCEPFPKLMMATIAAFLSSTFLPLALSTVSRKSHCCQQIVGSTKRIQALQICWHPQCRGPDTWAGWPAGVNEFAGQPKGATQFSFQRS